MAEAFRLARQKLPDLKLKIAGDGPLKTKLQSKLASLGLGEKVEFLGLVSPLTLSHYMRRASLLCLPSLSEGWPNVTMEAMACGAPIVGAKVGGLPEQIISEKYGRLCDPHSSSDIAEKIVSVIKSEWNHAHIAIHGKKYTRNSTAEAVFMIYKKILSY